MPCLDVRRFQFIHFAGGRDWLCDTRDGVERLLAVGGWIRNWKHRGGRHVALCYDKVTYIDMLFVPCSENEFYTIHLVQNE